MSKSSKLDIMADATALTGQTGMIGDGQPNHMPVGTAPSARTGADGQPAAQDLLSAQEKLESMELKILQAELEAAVNEMEEDGVAKAQLRILLGMQAMMVESYQAQRKSLQVSMLSTKVIETCTKLLSHHVNCMEGQLKSLSKYIERDVDLGQSTLDNMESTLDKFGTSFNTLGDTLKDMFASQSTSGNTEEDLRKRALNELSGLKEVMGHARTNTMNQVKEMRNATWETRELRSSTTDTSGDTSASGGSLLLTIDKNLQAAANSCIEATEKMTSTLMEAIERAEKPEVSHKRRAEQELAEQERKKAMLERQNQEPRHKCYHPISGQEMFLTSGERNELFKSLNLMQQGDEAMGPPPNPHAAPPALYQSASGLPHGMPSTGVPSGFPPAAPYGTPYYGAPPEDLSGGWYQNFFDFG